MFIRKPLHIKMRLIVAEFVTHKTKQKGAKKSSLELMSFDSLLHNVYVKCLRSMRLNVYILYLFGCH